MKNSLFILSLSLFLYSCEKIEIEHETCPSYDGFDTMTTQVMVYEGITYPIETDFKFQEEYVEVNHWQLIGQWEDNHIIFHSTDGWTLILTCNTVSIYNQLKSYRYERN